MTSYRYHYSTVDVVPVVVDDSNGDDIDDTVGVSAGLGTAYRPPVALTACTWSTPAGVSREFLMPLNPVTSALPNGVYRVWYRLTDGPLQPIMVTDDRVVIFGRPDAP